jgi:hypothetical protein
MAQDTLEGALERLDLVLRECVQAYLASPVLISLGLSSVLMRRMLLEVERKWLTYVTMNSV